MGLFDIHIPRDLHIHLTIKTESDQTLNELRDILIKIQHQNSKIMSVAEDLKALATQAKASLDNIKLDVAKLAGGINPDGLTAQEAQDLKAQLTEIAGEAADIDALTPNDEPTPTPDQPTA